MERRLALAVVLASMLTACDGICVRQYTGMEMCAEEDFWTTCKLKGGSWHSNDGDSKADRAQQLKSTCATLGFTEGSGPYTRTAASGSVP